MVSAGLTWIQDEFVRWKGKLIDDPRELLIEKTNYVEDPGAVTYAKDKPT